MAIKYPIRQSTLVIKVQDFMDGEAKDAARIMETNPDYAALRLHELAGMEKLARDLGVECSCFHSEWTDRSKGRYVCRCRPMTARERKQSLSGALGKSGGPHCRDEDGAFVPVPQCTRKLPADIIIHTPPAPAKRKRKRKKKRS